MGPSPRKCRKFVVVAAAVLILAVGAPVSVRATNGSVSDDHVLAVAAAKAGAPRERLEVGDRFTVELRLTGRILDVAKVVWPETGKVVRVAVDQNGRTVDFDAAQRRENAARAARYGKLDPRLADKLDRLKPRKKLPVSVWVKAPDPPRRSSARSTPSQRLAAVEAAVTPAVRRVADAIARMGGSATTARAAPAVFAELNRGQIEALARRADVATIYGPEEYTLLLDDAGTTLKAYWVWGGGYTGLWGGGNTGAGTRVAVNEPGGVSDTNPFLNNATHPVVFYCSFPSVRCPRGKNTELDNAHASRVAGQIASTHPQFRGIAPSAALILSENTQSFFDDDVVDAIEWGVGNGADVTNMSWGKTCGGFETFMSRYVDWAVKHLRHTFTIAAGNNQCGDQTNEKVVAPGVAWSAITVGATNDKFDGWWANDEIASFSSHGNPDFAPGMEKPEVVAVGGNVCGTNLTGVDGLICSQGTSLAAPQVAGIVADMIARRPGQDAWPETNKAAILASAGHDITPGTSRDGVGEPVAIHADDTYRLGRFFNDTLGAGERPTLVDRNIDHKVPLSAGDRVRVAISWDSISDEESNDTLAGEDIDLRVLRPNGDLACYSVSVENAWELCEFTAPVTGTYTFRERVYSNPLAEATKVGMAYSIALNIPPYNPWWRVPNFCWGILQFPSGGGTFTVDTSNGPTYFDHYPAWPVDQWGREFVWSYHNDSPKTLTFSDTNPKIDLHAMRIPDCAADPISPTMLAHGSATLTVENASPGDYYFVADGRDGKATDLLDTFTLSVK